MATDTAIAKSLNQAYFEDALGSKANAIAEAARQRRMVVVPVALLAVEASAATLSSKILARTTGACKVTVARILPDAALTASDTNYATITIGYTDDLGGAATTVATITTQVTGGSGNWVADQSVAMTLATDPSVPTNKALKFISAKTAAGVAIPACKVELELEDM